jgi:hypothetical protein
MVLQALAMIGMPPPPTRWPQLPEFRAAWVRDLRTGVTTKLGPQWPWPERPVPVGRTR